LEHFQIGLKIEFNKIELDENQAATLITQGSWERAKGRVDK